MDICNIADLAPDLSNLEVALLLSLVAPEHCLIETTEDSIHDVAKELALISSNTFDLSYTIVDCFPDTCLDSFCKDILNTPRSRAHLSSRSGSLSNVSRFQTSQDSTPSNWKVANVVIAKNFHQANDYIQLYALELMRSKKLTFQSGTLAAPPDFLFVPVVVRSSDQFQPRLNAHLIDHLFISHYHDPKDGFTYLEDGNDWLSDGHMSGSSVVHKMKKCPKVTAEALEDFRQASKSTTTNVEVTRYQQDIVMFLRLSRGVAGGITSKANGHFQKLARLLGPLHGLDYLTPSLVTLAARKVFRHRIVVAKPEDDRSLQYGSEIKAVSKVLRHVTPESVLDEILELEAPL